MRETHDHEPLESAAELRMIALREEEKRQEEAAKRREAEHARHTAFANDFLNNHISEHEWHAIKRLIENAARQGRTRSMVYSFPSDLCTDKGRAINNGLEDWPRTLQGKARELYDDFESREKSLGYKLHAKVLNYPSGMPGDVGLFLDWGAV